MISLGSKNWGSAPTISASFAYEKKRSGTLMGYRIQVTISPLYGASYFGYPIYLKWAMEGVQRESVTLKAANPSRWTSAIVYTSGWFYVADKITGTTAVSFNLYSGSGASRNNTYSYVMDVDPAASEISAEDGTFEVEQILTVKQYDTSFSHTIEFSNGSYYGTICTKSKETSFLWKPPIELIAQYEVGTWFNIVLSIASYDSTGNAVGSNQTIIKCYLPDWVKPSVSLSFTDTTGSYEKYGKCVQGKSALDIKLTADGVYGSKIKSQSVAFDGKTYTENEFTTNVINNTGDIPLTATVTDSRNQENSVEKIISTMKYEPPKITGLKARRSDKYGNSESSGGYLAVDYSVVVSPLENLNSAKLTLKYKKTTEPDSAYISEELDILDATYVLHGATTVFAADPNSSYDIILVVEDDFYNSANSNAIEKGAVGSSAKKLFSWLARGLGWAFGKVAELEGVLDIAFKTYFRGGIFQPTIPLGKDLDEIIIPNTYSGLDASTAGYLNCPIEEGEFSLEVLGEEDGNLTHRLTVRNKYEPIIYERHKISGSWGGWLRLIVAVGDHIVAYGSGNGWTYRKWNSGLAECWATFGYENAILLPNWGTTPVAFDKAFPIAFTEMPTLTATLSHMVGWHHFLLMTNFSAENFERIDITGLVSANTPVSGLANVYAVGRWK